MLTLNSHGVEISIAGCVEEMVRTQFLSLFFFLISYALYQTTIGNKDYVQR